uniref:Uncharacterized protein n=1 Tax=Anguilla anguilla TaxID=7936 RepID=A0A0E9W284_ANGAN
MHTCCLNSFSDLSDRCLDILFIMARLLQSSVEVFRGLLNDIPSS